MNDTSFFPGSTLCPFLRWKALFELGDTVQRAVGDDGLRFAQVGRHRSYHSDAKAPAPDGN